jgi:uncharacterized protein (TIGR02328 family)
VFNYSPAYLVAFHSIVINEMIDRGYTVDPLWFNPCYRGKNCEPFSYISYIIAGCVSELDPIYPEHNDSYLIECIENLKAKGVILND